MHQVRLHQAGGDCAGIRNLGETIRENALEVRPGVRGAFGVTEKRGQDRRARLRALEPNRGGGSRRRRHRRAGVGRAAVAAMDAVSARSDDAQTRRAKNQSDELLHR